MWGTCVLGVNVGSVVVGDDATACEKSTDQRRGRSDVRIPAEFKNFDLLFWLEAGNHIIN